MRPMRLDPATADRLAAGLLSPDDTPQGYSGVADLLGAARRATPAQDPARHVGTLAAALAALTAADGPPEIPWRNKRMLTKRLSVRTAAMASVLVLAGGTAAAASTGSLPGPAQNTAATLLAHVGISVPGHGRGHGHGASDQGTSDTNSGAGPDSHALYGLCTAEAAHARHGVHPRSSVFPSASTCATVVKPGSTSGSPDDGTSGNGPSASGTAPSGAGQPSGTPVGPPSSVPVGAPATPPSSTPPAGEPPVSTPGHHPGPGGRP
jgi:hypothetical protein